MQTLGRENAKIAVDFLNDLLEKDPAVAQAIVSNYYNCNEQISDHQTIQVSSLGVCMLGILNGLFGLIGGEGERKNWGHIAAVTESYGQLIRFELTEEN